MARPRHFYRRRLFEWLGSARYSRPALGDLDRQLQRHVPGRDGVFVEAGANDGFTQSNTYFLERFRDWRGVLIEPLPELVERCRRERPLARVFQCALVGPEHRDPKVRMHDANLMSLVVGAQKSAEAERRHLRRAAEVQQIEVRQVEVPARTLSDVLDEAGLSRIDLLSLDVEGFELQALSGLDLTRHRPRYMLIEARFREEIDAHLDALYLPVATLSHHDVLYRLRSEPDPA